MKEQLLPPPPVVGPKMDAVDPGSMADTLPHAIQVRPEAKPTPTVAELVESARQKLELMIHDPKSALARIRSDKTDLGDDIAINTLVQLWAIEHHSTLVRDEDVLKALAVEDREARKSRFTRAFRALTESTSKAKSTLRDQILALSRKKEDLKIEVGQLEQRRDNAKEALSHLEQEIEMEERRKNTFLYGDLEIAARPEFKMMEEETAKLIDLLKTLHKRGPTLHRPHSLRGGIRAYEARQLITGFENTILSVLKDAEWKFGAPIRARMALQLVEQFGLQLTPLQFNHDMAPNAPRFGGDLFKECLKTLSNPSASFPEQATLFSSTMEQLVKDIDQFNTTFQDLPS